MFISVYTHIDLMLVCFTQFFVLTYRLDSVLPSFWVISPQILFKEKESKPVKDSKKDPTKKRKLRNDRE